MTTMAVSPSDVFDIWAQVYDEQPNPLLALEQRFLSRMLPDISGLDVLDAGCGTGRWLQLLGIAPPCQSGGGGRVSPDAATRLRQAWSEHRHCGWEAVPHCPARMPQPISFWPPSSSAIWRMWTPLLANSIASPGLAQISF